MKDSAECLGCPHDEIDDQVCRQLISNGIIRGVCWDQAGEPLTAQPPAAFIAPDMIPSLSDTHG